MSRSFAKNAPEVAEEILSKVASLPKELSDFSRALLTKEASGEKEKLALPARLSLADLQKMASGNKTDLPKVDGVSSDDWKKIASDLSSIAKRGEEEEARDVLAGAAALVAHRKEAVVARITQAPIASPTAGTRIKAFFGHTPSKQHVELDSLRHQVEVGKLRKKLPKDPLVQAEEVKADAAKSISEKRHRLAEHTIATAPAIGLAAGTPLAAAALMKGDKEKKEEVKIYK